VVHNFYYDNSDGSAASRINIGDLSLRLMTKVTGTNATFSGHDKDVSTAMSGSDEALLYYAAADNYVIKKGSTTLGSGPGMSVLPIGAKNVGWAHMSNGTQGVGAGVRFMWETYPKNLSVHTTGEVGIHLYSNYAQPLPFYGGAGRTHFACFAFTNSVDLVKEMYFALCQPPYPVASTKWLTAQTKVMGELLPCDPTVFEGNMAAMINQHKMMGFIYGHNMRKMELLNIDSYGFLEFGDLDDNRHGQGCPGRHWSNNYYDFPHCIAKAFIVTGSEYNLETGLAHALHLGDMDHSSVTGQSRTGPGYGDLGFKNYESCAIGYSPSSNHYKCQGMFDWSCLMAEPVLGEIGLRLAQWAKTDPYGSLRATGHVIQSMAGAYGYTNEAQWKTALENYCTTKNIVNLANGGGGSDFQQAILGESIMWTLI
jgi:hypothetical protein